MILGPVSFVPALLIAMIPHTIYEEEAAMRQETGIDSALVEDISRAGTFNPVE